MSFEEKTVAIVAAAGGPWPLISVPAMALENEFHGFLHIQWNILQLPGTVVSR